jgi:stress response protein YsnF
MNKQTVIGVFDTMSQARSARKALTNEGFTGSDIDVSKYGAHGKRDERYHDDDDNAIERFFENLFGDDDDDRRRMRREVASRGTVVTVHTSTMEKAKRAAAILDRYGAIDMEDRYKQYDSKSFNADNNRKRLNERFGNVDTDGTIDVVKEEVAIGKREVETDGSVTVRSHIIERPVEETLRLRKEEVYVKRTPVDRPADTADFKDRTISVKEKAEEAVVSKKARVVEEIEVGKNVDTRTETIRETARETEVDIVKDNATTKNTRS